MIIKRHALEECCIYLILILECCVHIAGSQGPFVINKEGIQLLAVPGAERFERPRYVARGTRISELLKFWLCFITVN